MTFITTQEKKKNNEIVLFVINFANFRLYFKNISNICICNCRVD